MYFSNSNSIYKEQFKNVNSKILLNGHKKRVYCLDWNDDGSKLASGSVDTTIRVKIKFQIQIVQIKFKKNVYIVF